MPDEARDGRNVALKFLSDCWRARSSKEEFLHQNFSMPNISFMTTDCIIGPVKQCTYVSTNGVHTSKGLIHRCNLVSLCMCLCLPTCAAGTFKLKIEFSEEYPNKPPSVKFVSKMFHPNGEMGHVGGADSLIGP